MTDCLWELQKAVFTALDGDVTLSGLVTGVYNHVPQDTAFPYVKFGKLSASDWSTKTNAGIRGEFNIDVFSQNRGSKEALAIMIEIKRILDGSALSMTGCSMISMKYNSTSVSHLGDGVTWQGNISFDSLIQES